MPNEINPLTGKTTQQVLEESTKVAQEAARVTGTTFTPGYTPSPILSNEQFSATPVPTLPEPQAPIAQEAFITGADKQLQSLKSQLETQYKQQLEDQKKRIEDLNKQQQELLKQAQPEASPTFEQEKRIRQTELDAAEAASKTIQQNFEENQRLTNELTALLTEGQAAITAEKARAVPTVIGRALTSKKAEEVAAQSGIISAVLASRNGQINQAYNIINHARDTVAAHKEDQRTYLNALLKLNESKALELSKAEKEYAENRTKQLETELGNLTTYAENIKSLMSDPRSALLIANAGITLSMPPEEVNSRLATEIQRQEIEDFKNTQIGKGFEFVPFPQFTSGQGIVTFDVGGQKLSFRQPIEAPVPGLPGEQPITTLSGKPLTDAQAVTLGYAKRMFDANQVISEVGGQFTGAISTIGQFLPNILKSEDRQRFEQAQRNFINAVLRKESGAAIIASEFESTARQYFPQPGDGEKVLAQKAANRQRAIESFQIASNVPLSEITGISGNGSYEDYLKAIQ